MLDGLQRDHGRCGDSAVPIGVTLESVGDWEVRVRDCYSSNVSSDSNSSLASSQEEVVCWMGCNVSLGGVETRRHPSASL